MGADQNLINSVKRMGPSKFRDDSGWVKALGAIGKYVAVKQKQFNKATENFNGVVEDVDIDGLRDYKTEVDGLLKTMKKTPAFMPAYKKAANRYNEIMSNVEGTKTLLSSLAKKKVLIGENAGDLSSYKSASEIATDADVMNSRYTTRMSDAGPVMVFNDGASEILVSDYVSSNPMLVSSSQDSIDKSYKIVNSGATSKINGQDYSKETVMLSVNSFVEEVWRGKNNEKTTMTFDVSYPMAEGEITFMDYYANTQENYKNALIKSRENIQDKDLDVISEEEAIEQEANYLKRSLWENSSQETLKQAYKDFLETSTRYQYDNNTSRYNNKNNEENKSKKVGANGYVRNYALSTEDPTKLKFDPDQEYVGFKTPKEIKGMEQKIDSNEPFLDWFMHRYTPVFDRKDPKRTIGFTVVLESGEKLPQMIPYQKVKNNLLGVGALD